MLAAVLEDFFAEERLHHLSLLLLFVVVAVDAEGDRDQADDRHENNEDDLRRLRGYRLRELTAAVELLLD